MSKNVDEWQLTKAGKTWSGKLEPAYPHLTNPVPLSHTTTFLPSAFILKKNHILTLYLIEIINYNIFYQARWESSIKALQHLFPDLHKFLAKRNHTTHSSKHKTITLKHLSKYGCVYLKMQTVWQNFLIKFFAKPNYLQQASWCYWDYTKDDFVPTVCKKNLELSFNCVTLVDQSRAKLLLFELDTGD